jgi:hypothetical protein
MAKLSERLAKAGVNTIVILIAIAVFVVAFVAQIAFGNASRPATIKILAASRDLSIGDTVAATDLVTINVYQDQLANQYIPPDQADQVVGGYTALPIHSGQPVMRNSIIAPAGMGTRLSAVLAKYPGYSLFPLPLDATNVAAAEADSYLPGDLVSVTIVIDSRPQPPTTPTPEDSSGSTTTPIPQPAATSEENALQDALNRGYPPMAKDIFPQGVMVIAVQGLPVQTVSQNNLSGSRSVDSNSTNVSQVDINQPKRLILLVPSESIEPLALGLQSGDRLIVSMVTAGQPKQTTGFTYWDLEELFRLEREGILK